MVSSSYFPGNGKMDLSNWSLKKSAWKKSEKQKNGRTKLKNQPWNVGQKSSPQFLQKNRPHIFCKKSSLDFLPKIVPVFFAKNRPRIFCKKSSLEFLQKNRPRIFCKKSSHFLGNGKMDSCKTTIFDFLSG